MNLTQDNKMTLSVVCPCYNESELIELFSKELIQTLDTLADIDYEIIFVDDGSTDDTLSKLNQISQDNQSIRICSLSRNFGHQIALTAGIDLACGDAVIMMDSDLQHPPQLIPEMIGKWKEGTEIISGVRKKTKDSSFFKNFTSKAFYCVINYLSSIHIPHGAADFCLLSHPVYNSLRKMPERHKFLRGMIAWVGFKRDYIYYDAPARSAGRSKYTFVKMFSLALDAIFSFSTFPLRIAVRIGATITFLGFLYLAWILARFFLLNDLVTGWASLICMVLILGGFQLIFIGIIGQYIARIFDEVKNRPAYITKQQAKKSFLSNIKTIHNKSDNAAETQI